MMYAKTVVVCLLLSCAGICNALSSTTDDPMTTGLSKYLSTDTSLDPFNESTTALDASVTESTVFDGPITSITLSPEVITSPGSKAESTVPYETKPETSATAEVWTGNATSLELGTGSTTSFEKGSTTRSDIETGSTTSYEEDTNSTTSSELDTRSSTSSDVRPGDTTSSDVDSGSTSSDVDIGSTTSSEMDTGSTTSSAEDAKSTTSSDVGTGNATSSEIDTGSTTSSEVDSANTTSSEISTINTSSEIDTGNSTSSEVYTGSTTSSELDTANTTSSEISTINTTSSEIDTGTSTSSELYTGNTTSSVVMTVSTTLDTGTNTTSTVSDTTSDQTPPSLGPGESPINPEATHDLRMELPLIRSFTEELSDPTSTEYQKLSLNITSQISAVIIDGIQASLAPSGFVDVDFVRFSNTSEAVGLVHVRQTDRVLAAYDIRYAVSSLHLDDVDRLETYITGAFTGDIANRTFLGSAVDVTTLETYNKEILPAEIDKLKGEVNDTCLVDDVCDVCWVCVDQGAGCRLLCNTDQECTVNDMGGDPTCGCSDDHVTMLDSCVDKNLVIGLFAGIGGAMFIGLIVGIAVLASSRNKKKTDKSDGNEEMIPMRPTTEATMFTNAGYELTEPPINDYIPASDYDDDMGTFKNAGPQGKAPQAEGRTRPVSMQGAQPIGTDDIEPLGMDNQPIGSKRDSTASYTYLVDTEAYQRFSPSVSHIDPNKDYFAERPRINVKK